MILADTSIWIEFLRRRNPRKIEERLLLEIITCPVIIQEVFQGLVDSRKAEEFKEFFLALPKTADFVPLDCFLQAAEIYSRGRKKGITIRSSADCLIAAIAIKDNLPVWHNDRDFSSIAKFTGLKIYTERN